MRYFNLFVAEYCAIMSGMVISGLITIFEISNMPLLIKICVCGICGCIFTMCITRCAYHGILFLEDNKLELK